MSPVSSPLVSRRPLPPWTPADLALAVSPGPVAVLDGLSCAGHRCALVAWAPSRRAATLDRALALVSAKVDAPASGAPPLLVAAVGALAWDGRADFWLPGAAAIFDPEAGAVWLRGEAAVAAADRLDAAVASSREGAARSHDGVARSLRDAAPPHDGVARTSPALCRSEARPLWSGAFFQNMVRQAQAEMVAGFIQKAVLSVPFQAPCGLSPAQVYQRVAARQAHGLNFLLDAGEAGWALVGTSPEPLVRLHAGRAEMHLLAGTRAAPAPAGAAPPTGKLGATASGSGAAPLPGSTAPGDATLDLAASAKDRREHLLAVEQARRDLEQVCAPGAVAVEALLTVEEHPGLLHLASHLAGRLAPDTSSAALVRAIFPTGTVAGVPKAEAAAVIGRLEPLPRDWYAGAVGALLPGDDLDLWLILRTVLLEGGVATVRTGAGIVAESDPQAEWRECLAKAAPTLALIDAEVTCNA